ncbi:MAG: PEP-CTERM sorting domain-containing protein, partial [Myxococcota bacterium]
ETISLAFTSSNLIQAGTLVHNPATIGLAGIPISVVVPEPAAGGLALAGLATVTLLYRTHRRRAQR